MTQSGHESGLVMVITSRKMLYDQMNAELKTNGFDLRVSDKASFQEALKTLREQTKQSERMERGLRLDAFASDIQNLQVKLAHLDERHTLIQRYNDLINERDAIGQIQLNNFLTAGARVLGGKYEDHKCPFCLQHYDLEKLRVEVESRLNAISQITEKLKLATTNVTYAY